MVALVLAAAAAVLAAAGEWLHAARLRALGRLPFPPPCRPRAWIRAVPVARVLAMGTATWGFAVLAWATPVAPRVREERDAGLRHGLVIVLDISRSMRLEDAGTDGRTTRLNRARELVEGVFKDLPSGRCEITLVCFTSHAQEIIVDTWDIRLASHVLHLTLDDAFRGGKTKLYEGLRLGFDRARPVRPSSGTTVILVTDGDTLADGEMPLRPASVGHMLILGVGSREGRFYDDHISRQDESVLKDLEARLGADYHDVNSQPIPDRAVSHFWSHAGAHPGWPAEGPDREMALGAATVGVTVLVLLPALLSRFGIAQPRPAT